mmetsp:Transcript_2457/g.6584  ORF Transcript_2457/g.6584 Transcript_2457/m.6584 type:complete len:80 (-) Transcript_2457:223-462(-)
MLLDPPWCPWSGSGLLSATGSGNYHVGRSSQGLLSRPARRSPRCICPPRQRDEKHLKLDATAAEAATTAEEIVAWMACC